MVRHNIMPKTQRHNANAESLWETEYQCQDRCCKMQHPCSPGDMISKVRPDFSRRCDVCLKMVCKRKYSCLPCVDYMGDSQMLGFHSAGQVFVLHVCTMLWLLLSTGALKTWPSKAPRPITCLHLSIGALYTAFHLHPSFAGGCWQLLPFAASMPEISIVLCSSTQHDTIRPSVWLLYPSVVRWQLPLVI